MFRKSLNFSKVLDSYALLMSSKAVTSGVPRFFLKINNLDGLQLSWIPQFFMIISPDMAQIWQKINLKRRQVTHIEVT
jgi:hypothetical protein